MAINTGSYLVLCAVLFFVAMVVYLSTGTDSGHTARLLKTAPKRTSLVEMIGTDPTIALLGPLPKAKLPRNISKNYEATDAGYNSTVENGKNATITADHEHSRKSLAINVSSVEVVDRNSQKEKKDSGLFFIYDLDEEFWWRWPVDGSDCSGNGYVGHDHKEYSGIGPLVQPDNGLYLTWHFSLFSSLYNRMKRSSRRTLDPEKASLFIIPYDLGLDGYLDARTCQNRRQCTGGLVGKLTSILSKSKYFQRHQGADHALLWSLGQYHPWPRAGCDVLMKDFCAKCTITCYWMDATKADSRFVSVPFPSGYHWWDGIKNLPWDLSLAPQRNLTAVYLGSTQTLNPTHTKIRRAMTAQCETSSECHWFKIAHSSKDTSIADFLSIYKRATFCLCPPGDDPARKAVFDCIISGSIPVIFELNTLYNQYPWHITEQQALDISVYIPGGAVRSGKLDFMSVLLAISPEVIRKKQQVLAGVAPRMQYAMPPPERLLDRYDNTTWDPPFKDGVELTLDGMFTRVDNVLNNRSTGIPHRLMSGREWGREYDMVRVQVPNMTEDSVAVQEEQDKLIRQGSKAGLNPHHTGRGAHHGAYNGHGAHNALKGQQNVASSGGHANGHGNGHNRRHKISAGSPGGGVEGGDHQLGKHGALNVHHGGKGGRHVPAMVAPGEEENQHLPALRC